MVSSYFIYYFDFPVWSAWNGLYLVKNQNELKILIPDTQLNFLTDVLYLKSQIPSLI